MKLSPVLILALLPFLTMANPVAEPEPVPVAEPEPEPVLEARADKWCRLHPDVDGYVNCRAGTNTNSRIIRQISKSERFGVRCKRNGESVSGNRVWDWIPGWGCYVSARYTNDGCESKPFRVLRMMRCGRRRRLTRVQLVFRTVKRVHENQR